MFKPTIFRASFSAIVGNEDKTTANACSAVNTPSLIRATTSTKDAICAPFNALFATSISGVVIVGSIAFVGVSIGVSILINGLLSFTLTSPITPLNSNI